jgi:predicted anti-sigma-YlaC factor YlaD
MAGNDLLLPEGPCKRAREWVSLRVDGELSPLEGELLARHLAGCEGCRAYEADVRWATDVIRLTPQERPSRRVSVPVAGRRRAFGPRIAAAAAVAALAAGALVGAVVERQPSQGPANEPTEVSLLTDAILIPKVSRTRILAPVDPAPTTPAPAPPKGVI